MQVLISSQANHRGEIAYLAHGSTESAARRAYFEWLNKGLNPDDQEALGGRLIDGAQCTDRLISALNGPSEDGDFAAAMHNYNWAIGSLYFNSDDELDARYLSAEEWYQDHPHLRRRPAAAEQFDTTEPDDDYVDD